MLDPAYNSCCRLAALTRVSFFFFSTGALGGLGASPPWALFPYTGYVILGGLDTTGQNLTHTV